jgi:hypothetical protein
MNRNRLYVLLSAACAVGFIWLTITYNRIITNESEIGVCLFKRITNLPCPSCGSTRSVLSLLKGDIFGALFWNPIGFILVAIMFISPFWILYDIIASKSTLFNFYTNSEQILKRKWVAISVIFIVLLNWIWNIYKGV